VSERKLTGKDIEWIMLIAQDVLSLNTPVTMGDSGDIGDELGDFIEDPGPTPEEEVILSDRRVTLVKYIKKFLNPREQRIIFLRFGFETGEPLTLEEVGAKLGITRERVRQIEEKALRRLKFQFTRNKITWETI
jgi:RNA polymerase primary sigma factor